MPETLQISRWKKSKVRKKCSVATILILELWLIIPNTKKVRPITDVYNLQDETLSENFLDLDDEQPRQQLEVVVTDKQHTMTFNSEQVHICEQYSVWTTD